MPQDILTKQKWFPDLVRKNIKEVFGVEELPFEGINYFTLPPVTQIKRVYPVIKNVNYYDDPPVFTKTFKPKELGLDEKDIR